MSLAANNPYEINGPKFIQFSFFYFLILLPIFLHRLNLFRCFDEIKIKTDIQITLKNKQQKISENFVLIQFGQNEVFVFCFIDTLETSLSYLGKAMALFFLPLSYIGRTWENKIFYFDSFFLFCSVACCCLCVFFYLRHMLCYLFVKDKIYLT